MNVVDPDAIFFEQRFSGDRLFPTQLKYDGDKLALSEWPSFDTFSSDNAALYWNGVGFLIIIIL